MSYYFQLISGNKKGGVADLFRGLLWVFSLLYGSVVSIRRLLYALKVKKTTQVDAFVISIGNITAGGTGKTPFTIYLAEKLAAHPVGILLRGFRSAAEARPRPTRVTTQDVHEVGDEALLLKRSCPTASVYVGKDRIGSARQALADGCRVLILDDGMQRLSLKRDVNICLIDALNPFGWGYLLPRGLLREPVAGLKRADLIVITRSEHAGEDLEQTLRLLTPAPIIRATLVVEGFYDLKDRPVALLPGEKIALFSAIGNPKAFEATVREAGFDPVYSESFPDHEVVGVNELHRLQEEAARRGARFVVCTEKDRVKIDADQLMPQHPSSHPVEIVYLRVRMHLFDDAPLITALQGLS